MTRRGLNLLLVVSTLLAAGSVIIAASRQPSRAPSGAAWRIVEWPSGRLVGGERAAQLDRPAQPGSFLKLPTLVAALASGLVSADTRVPCQGSATVHGQVVRCSHPRLRHPLRPAEALAMSCNVWFATIGDRLPRARLDGVLTMLGLPPTPADAPMALAATGLRASAVPPALLVEALGRLLREPSAVPISPAARAVIVEGLRGAALYGTASAFADQGLDALAKTGTADGPGGGVQGIVVAAWPSRAPTRAMILLAPGAAGKDAAVLAARIAMGAGDPRVVATAPLARVTPPVPASGSTVKGSAVSAPAGLEVRVGFPRTGGGYTARAVPLEDYVARVIAGEAEANSRPAALEALAITVRTFALANRGRHQRDGFDLCTLTHCQVLREPYPAARAAAASTAGQVLAWDGAPASVFYTASCGGRSERPSSVWPGAADPPYLGSHRDRSCGGEPRWAAEIPVHDFERALRTAGFAGELREVRVAGHSSSGRVASLQLRGMRPGEITGQDLRTIVGRVLGWHLIKSTDFAVRRTGGGYRFDGRGFGHGVGLCVIGSARRAEHGESAASILKTYFHGLTIRQAQALRLPGPRAQSAAAPALANGSDMDPQLADAPAETPAATRAAAAPPSSTPRTPASPSVATGPSRAAVQITIVLPASAERERAALTTFARSAIGALSAASGEPPPPELRLVFHPSPDSFRRETGEPWWTAAHTDGQRIDLQPVHVLRARGTLETTIRHEIAHVLTAAPLDGRPAWVREGVAMYFAGEPPPASLAGPDATNRRFKCPSDDALRRPVSAALARQAYALAGACVARAMEGGRSWREVR